MPLIGWEFEFSYVSDVEYMTNMLSEDGFCEFEFYETNPGGKLRLFTHSYVYEPGQQSQYLLWLIKHTPWTVRLIRSGTIEDDKIYYSIPQPTYEAQELCNRICELCAPTDEYFRNNVNKYKQFLKRVAPAALYDVLVDAIIQYIPLYLMYKAYARR